MQITIKTQDQAIFEKIMSVLEPFRFDGVDISPSRSLQNSTGKLTEMTDDYIEAHWRELIITHSMSDEYESSVEYRNDYAEYLEGICDKISQAGSGGTSLFSASYSSHFLSMR